MSSAAYIKPKSPISREEWIQFCNENGIVHSPNTIGGNVFYYNGLGGVEITFGEANYKQRVEKIPPETASRITVSSFHGQNLVDIASITKLITKRWVCDLTNDEELNDFIWEVRQGK